MDVRFILYLLYFVFYCDCQFPLNQGFTDQFGSDPRRLRVLTEATNQRILSQFQNQPNVPTLDSLMNGLFPNAENSVVGNSPSFGIDIKTELDRLGIRNTDLITNPSVSAATRGNLGNFGITDLFSRHSSQLKSSINNQNQQTGSDIQRGRKSLVQGNQQQDIPFFSTVINQPRRMNTTNDGPTQKNKPILAPTNHQPFGDLSALNVPSSNNNQDASTDNMLSEAALLQMGTDELAALGKHGISLNSIVDTNSDFFGKQSTPKSSTEEQLITALLDRLIELKDQRARRHQVNTMRQPSLDDSMLHRPEFHDNRGPQQQANTMRRPSLDNSMLHRPEFHDNRGAQQQANTIRQPSLDNSLLNRPELIDNFGRNQQATSMRQTNLDNSMVHRPASRFQDVISNQNTKNIGDAELARTFSNSQSTGNTWDQKNDANPGNTHVQNLPYLSCQYRGCNAGQYCITMAISELFADFCSSNTLELCKCSPGKLNVFQ
ncbi:unnamed protein product [Mytilus edulis]|uniref:Uncharacterized protein n=1 Tax=Mytilus edulis TaxID=6550 RepID=A0A8S3SML6_MYTED|nr:unnamed protein product [Mytilus edulis]